MTKTDRLSGPFEWIESDFAERERTPEFATQVGIHLHVARLSISNTKQHLDTLGVERSRTAIHDRVQKAEVQPSSTANPNQVAVNETVIQMNDQRRWLFAAVDPETNEFLHVRLFQTRCTGTTLLFLDELREKQQVDDAEFSRR